MVDTNAAIERVRKFYMALAVHDYNACIATLSPDVVRVGPRVMAPGSQSAEIVAPGRDAYGAFIRRMMSQMPSYHGIIHELVASPDGKRVYIHCTEWADPPPGSTEEVKVPMIMICHVNEDCLISMVDIYWKTPQEPVVWSKGKDAPRAA